MGYLSKKAIIIALILTLVIGFGYHRARRFEQRRLEIDRLNRSIEDARRNVEEKEREAAELEDELKVMESEPAARESAVREGLRWHREGERIYIIEEPWAVVPAERAEGGNVERPDRSPESPGDSGGTSPAGSAQDVNLAPLVPPEVPESSVAVP